VVSVVGHQKAVKENAYSDVNAHIDYSRGVKSQASHYRRSVFNEKKLTSANLQCL